MQCTRATPAQGGGGRRLLRATAPQFDKPRRIVMVNDIFSVQDTTVQRSTHPFVRAQAVTRLRHQRPCRSRKAVRPCHGHSVQWALVLRATQTVVRPAWTQPWLLPEGWLLGAPPRNQHHPAALPAVLFQIVFTLTKQSFTRTHLIQTDRSACWCQRMQLCC